MFGGADEAASPSNGEYMCLWLWVFGGRTLLDCSNRGRAPLWVVLVVAWVTLQATSDCQVRCQCVGFVVWLGIAVKSPLRTKPVCL